MNKYRHSYIKILFIFPLVAPKLFNIINSCLLSYKLAFKMLIILIIAIITSILNAMLAGHCLDVPSVSIFIATIIGISCKKLNVKN